MADTSFSQWLVSLAAGRALSAGQKRLLRALAEEPERFMLVTIREFAAAAGVSPATASRCIAHLGYAQYADFQRDLKARLFQPQKLTSVYNYLETERQADLGLTARILEAEREVLSGLFAAVDGAVFHEAAAAAARAGRVHLIGFGSSTALIRFLQYRFLRIGLDVVDMTPVSQLNMLAEHCVHMDARRDVIISVSFRGVYETIVHLLRFAAAFHIPSIAFSENADSEISRLSSFRIPIKRAVIDEFKSLAAPMSLMNAFAMRTAGFLEPKKAAITRRLAWFTKYQENNKL